MDEPEQVLPSAPVRRPIMAERAGTFAAVDAEGLGRASGDLGAGRKKKGDAGQELGRVHARSEGDAEAGIRAVHATMTIGDEPVEPPPLVFGWHG